MKQAGIYVNGIYCGILTEDEEGFHFVYDEAYLTQSGIPATVAEKMIQRMKTYLPKWKNLIAQSFLPDKMKTNYHQLLSQRIELL